MSNQAITQTRQKYTFLMVAGTVEILETLSSLNQPVTEAEENLRNVIPAFQRSCDTPGAGAGGEQAGAWASCVGLPSSPCCPTPKP